ncbi:hypothetical protein [Marinomonas shanghaiensis]|uniref:hypothetical protein n=1 Tax=Marinomonas shanghaiensis TaxID=2202418 RepID=UPI000DBA09FA|nr:hypothetical protein [Marinomonas shanghaiensis]
MSNYIKKTYNVPADIGRKVIVDGKSGVIVENKSHHLGVNFDADKASVVSRCHPTWKVIYLDEFAAIRKLTKSQQRYKRFLEYGDSFKSFIDFCYWDAEQQRQDRV